MPLYSLAGEPVAVDIVGADKKLAENIKLSLGTIERAELNNSFFARQLTAMIEKSIRGMGYYQAKFTTEVIAADETTATLRITVDKGKPVVWEKAAIQVKGDADQLPELQTLLAKPPFVPGMVMQHPVYDEYKQRIIDICIKNGYQNAKFSRSELRINIKENKARAFITVDSGTRYKISSINYSGSNLSDEILDSLAVLTVGDWYSRRLVTRQYRALLDSQYFSSVSVDPVHNHQQGLVSIQIILQDSSPNDVLLGAGFDTDLGPQFTIKWSKPIISSKGHSFNSSLELAESVQEITARYQIPVGHPLDRYIELGAGVQNKTVEDTESILITTGLNLHTSKNKWKRVFGINIESEQYQQGTEAKQSTTYVMPAASWSYATLAAAEERGYRLWLDVQASTENLYSDTNFLRVVTGIKTILPIAKRHALISRLELGAIYNEDFSGVPSSKRFFTGGDQSVRGYSYESLAPRNAQGELIGGDRLNVGSLEYQWRFAERWGVAAFVDTGRAYFRSSDAFRTGAGIGARWFSPVGQLRFDLAFPINDAEYQGFQLHISMGPQI